MNDNSWIGANILQDYGRFCKRINDKTSFYRLIIDFVVSVIDVCSDSSQRVTAVTAVRDVIDNVDDDKKEMLL